MAPPPHKKPASGDLSLSRPAASREGTLPLAGGGSVSAGGASLVGGGAPLGPGGGLAPPRRHRSRLPSAVASLLILVGLLLLLDAGVTLVWQEPITALYSYFKQER